MEFLEGEIWLDIKGFEGKYKVSNFGRVKRIGAIRNGKRREFEVKGYKSKTYHKVRLSQGKRKLNKGFLLHRLVLCTFTDKPHDYFLYVNHIDENKHNNNLTNLEWVTPKENTNHGTCIKRTRETKLAKRDLSQYEIEKISRERFSILCSRREMNPLDYTETWDGVSFSNNARPRKLYNYFYVGEGKGFRNPVNQSGSNNPSAKPKDNWYHNPTTRKNFTIVCKRRGWDIEEFEEIFKGTNKNNEKIYAYKPK